ncbi:hypothetical protein Dfri01_64540 [Dyadobacter frigoris]|uniref:chemotaxis protein CheB n=1 Tax=Dyadobacter frigoris TaxID=2576211 RepID=UPI0024A3FAC5|nr:chemotaxis protein CheB [Dyadobacter frigoris]GLU56993.1 hypothetical protein Dfri01_64540 [Dyadobacter frigoris]
MRIEILNIILTRKSVNQNGTMSRWPGSIIDTFFYSLAHEYGSKAIALILSGVGTDGREGARAIKNSGGIVLARNPNTTAFSSMPASVIHSGVVNNILEPAQIAQALQKILSG